MNSTKPYLIRAIHEWCTDEGFTPYLAVRIAPRTRVPREFVRDGQIVLNVSLDATHQLQLNNQEITFQTRFNGASYPVLVHVEDVLAIYARENGQGMAFEPEDAGAPRQDGEVTTIDPPRLEAVKVGTGETADETTVDDETAMPRRGGHLTRIK